MSRVTHSGSHGTPSLPFPSLPFPTYNHLLNLHRYGHNARPVDNSKRDSWSEVGCKPQAENKTSWTDLQLADHIHAMTQLRANQDPETTGVLDAQIASAQEILKTRRSR